MSLVFTKEWIVDGAATAPDSITIGILDVTAGVQAVAFGTPMAMISTGHYQYTLGSADPTHAYSALIEVVWQGTAYEFQALSPVESPGPPPTPPPVPSPISPESSHHGPHDLARAIAENATSAESVSSAAGQQKSHSLESQIAADKYLASRRARRKGFSGLRVMPMRGGPSG